MTQGLNDSSEKKSLDVALELASAGDFSGLSSVVAALTNANDEIRLKAAYVCERIGFSAAMAPLARMALGDKVSANRNQAIFALVAIGRPAVVPELIAALRDENPERREDARVALYRVVGKDVLRLLADEADGSNYDATEVNRVTNWWHSESVRFDSELVYALRELASPAVFIRQLEAATIALPDAYLDSLHDWTGKDFGQSPLPKVIAKWKKWWAKSAGNYEAGRRYFYSYRVP